MAYIDSPRRERFNGSQMIATTMSRTTAARGSHSLPSGPVMLSFSHSDAPPPGAMNAARDLLRRLGALAASNAITPLGKRMLALGTHPRLAAMLLSAGEGEHRALACDLAALVEARDPLRMGGDALAARWRALAAFRNGRAPQDANRSGLAAIEA